MAETCSISNALGVLLPLRPSDLIHTQGAILERTEEILALDRLDLRKVEPTHWGFILRLSVSPRLGGWWSAHRHKKKHLWLDSAELDQFGTHLLLSRQVADKGFGTYAAVCSWRDVPAAAADMRLRCLGPILMKTYARSIFRSTVDEIAQQFQLDLK